MKKRLAILLSLLILLVIFAAPLSVRADFGDFSGGSDYGGSDYGGSDSGGSYDSDSGSYSGSSVGDGETDPETVIIILIAVAIPVIIAVSNQNKNRTRSGTGSVAPGATPTTALQPIDRLQQDDPDFDPEAVKQRLSNLYVQMQNGWTACDISSLRGNFTDDQFAQYDRQLQAYRDAGHTPVVERIAVLDVSLMGCKQDEQHDILIANLYTRITTYTLDKAGQVVSGSRTAEKFMTYEWTLVRPKGTKTQSGGQPLSTCNCPNCGAAIDINAAAKCPYCGSIVSRADYDWVIAGIKGLSQRTVG